MPLENNNKKLRILWVKMGGLWPVNSGGRLRSFHIINELSKHNEVTLLTTHGDREGVLELRENLPFCKRVESFPFAPPKKDSKAFLFSLLASWFSRLPVDIYKYQCPELSSETDRLLTYGHFDLCIADFLTAVPNIPVDTKTPVLHFSHNVEHMIWKRLHDNERSRIKKMLLAIEWRKMRRYERRACNLCVATIAVSDEDTQLLSEQSPKATITSVPTGVDTQYFTPDAGVEKKRHSLVFSGSMDWFPNEDAMLFFMQEVLPLVRSEVPDVSFSIVGRNPSALLRAEAKIHDVEVTGTVADIRPWLSRAELYIVPLRIGGGTRLKIYEALAMGLPVISTTIGAEGLDLLEGSEIVRADDATAFASQILALFENSALRATLGQNGRHLVSEKYSWSRIAQSFAAQCGDAVSNSRSELISHKEPFRNINNIQEIKR